MDGAGNVYAAPPSNGGAFDTPTINGDSTFGLAPGAERYLNGGHAVNGTNGTPVTLTNGSGPAPHEVDGPTDSKSGAPPAAPTPVDDEKTPVVMDYTTDFPELPMAPSSKLLTGVWGSRIKSTNVTETLTFAANERASKLGKRLGDLTEDQQKCYSIAQKTGAKIDLSEARDNSLTVLISGKRSEVDNARTLLLKELQNQANSEIRVPKEYRGAVIGKERSKLRKLEEEFACKIQMTGHDANEVLKVHGPPEYVAAAVKRIEQIVADLSKQANEHLLIPRAVFPWIRGPANENVDRLEAENNVKIRFPPLSVENGTINVSGEREGVFRVVDVIKRIADAKKNVASVACNIPRTQHRYVLGIRRTGLDEILRHTDVVVDVPPEEENSDVLTLRGDPSRLAEALSMVYAKATSVISHEIRYDEWQRRFLIGQKGSTLQQLVPNQTKLKIDFEDGGIIYLEGDPEQVKVAGDALQTEIERLRRELSSEVISVPIPLHRHIVGRNGTLITKLKNEHDVQINIPDEAKGSEEIRIEGKKEGVAKAIAAIREIVNRLENEKSKDIIIEQRFHRLLIGKAGENINKWREEFPTVNISIPEATIKSDIVNLRGDKKEVDKLYSAIHKLNKELLESNYTETVSIFREYYKHIIGKNGANINKIREETGTKIELPPQGSTDNRLTVVGKKANVEKAIAKLNQIQNEQASIVTKELNITPAVHTRLSNFGRKLVRDIEDEFGGVHINVQKDKLTVWGPQEDVARAFKALTDLTKNLETTTDEATVVTKPEYAKFLIGREGAKISKLREGYKSVRIIFSDPSADQEQVKIYIVGEKGEVEAVKKSIEQQIKELNETVEEKFFVEPKHHRHFVLRGAEVIRKIQDQNGGVIISFPRQDSAESLVTLKGSKNCVESAKQRILEIVDDLEHQTTIHLDIPHQHHRHLISAVRDLRNQYNVRINLPARGTTDTDGDFVDGISPANLVTIIGRDTAVEEARAALIEHIPVSESIHIASDYHSSIIGKGGEAVQKLMSTHTVRIKIPPSAQKSDEIVVSGARPNVESALEALKARVAELDGLAEVRKLKSFAVTLSVPVKYHQRLIGANGSNIKKLQEAHEVQIKLPRGEEGSEIVTITGFEEKANAARDEIQAFVDDLNSLISQEVELDPRFHPRLIGNKGRNLKKIMDTYKVDIRMPSRNDANPALVVVSGKDEASIVDCIEALRTQEDDYLEDLVERGAYHAPRAPEPTPTRTQRSVQIQGAPWQLDNDHFPAMGSGGAPSVASGVWGQRR